MIFIYAFYIDLFVEQNFLMNLIVLSLTYIFCKNAVPMRHLRMFLAAVCGTVALTLLLLFGPGYGWAMAGNAFLVVPAMLYIAFGWDGKRAFVLRLGASWLSIVILDGVATALENLTGLRCLVFYAGIVVLMIARALTELMLSSVRRQGRMYRIIFMQGATSVACMGLFDTGNLLSIPDTGEPVHIVSPGILERLGVIDNGELRMIPFHALGTDEGWIRVAQVERLEVRMGRKRRTYQNVWCGVAEPALLAGRSYQAILNSSLSAMA